MCYGINSLLFFFKIRTYTSYFNFLIWTTCKAYFHFDKSLLLLKVVEVASLLF